MRHFELSEGISNKLWEITLEVRAFTVRHGRIGAEGHAAAKLFSTEAKTRAEHDKLVAETLKKGYVETRRVILTRCYGRFDDTAS